MTNSIGLVTSNERCTSKEQRLVELLDRCLGDMQAGRSVDRETLLADNPELADELVDYLDSLQFIAGFRPADEPAAPNLAESLRTLGDFRIIRELGRGGMGVVYEAEQISLGRRVALKVLPFAGVLDERQLKRFKLEAAAAAALKHPNIVSVYCVGCERSVHFYAMEYIEGQTLADVIEGLRLAVGGTPNLECCDLSQLSFSRDVARHTGAHGNGAPTEIQSDDKSSHSKETVAAALSTLRTERPRDFYRNVAELGIQAADALEHAHQMGIVHRDIKPANLLLDQAGKLYIADFGLARLSTDAGMTLSGDMLGTLRYMSPEQASGAKLLDERTDIYSLGVTLYELLALQPAFAENDRQKLIRQVAEQEPPRLRAIDPRIPGHFETIILKAMAKEPAERYASAAELVADLKRFSSDQPICARRPSLPARAARLARRHPGAILGASSALACLLLVATTAFFIVADEKKQTSTSLQEKTAALNKSEASLNVAREAVDGLYIDFAASWLANSATPSAVQREFLDRAARFYEELAQEAQHDPARLRETATAYARIAEIYSYLHQNTRRAVARKIDHAGAKTCTKERRHR